LRTATLALVHSTAEYCAPVWCRSAHTRLIDPAINDALRIVTGCLRPIPADNLPILAFIQLAELRRRGATLSLGRRAMEPGHLLRSALTRPSGAAARLLNSRHPFVLDAQRLMLTTTTTYVRRSGRTINGTRSGRTTPQDSTLQFKTPVHTLPEWPSQEEPGSGSTAYAPVSDVSAPACTSGVWPVVTHVKSEREGSIVIKWKVGYLCATCVLFSMVWRELLQSEMIIKHTRGWEIDERNLKSMNLTHFHPKRIEHLKKSNILVNIRFVAKTSDIRNFSQNFKSDVETSEVATLVSISVVTGVSFVNIRLSPSSTSDNIRFLHYSFI